MTTPTTTASTPLTHPARAGWRLWSSFWFDPIPASRVGLLRIWLFGFAALDVLLRDEASVALGDTPRMFWRPVGMTWLLDQLGVGPPGAWQIAVVQTGLVLTAVLAAVGYRYRFTAPVAAVLYLYWQCLGQSWGEMKHARVTLILALLFLSVVSAQQRLSVDSWRARRREASAVARRRPVDRAVARRGVGCPRHPGRPGGAVLPVRLLQASCRRHRLDLG